MMTKDEALRGLTIGDCRTRREAVKTVKELLNRAVEPSYNSIKTELKSDMISRQAVLDLAEKGVLISNGNYESVCKAINEIPTVNLQPKTGHWKHNKCDVCGASRPPLFDNYCPNCGLKMIEPQESEDLGDYPDTIHNQFDNMTGSMNL